MMNDRSSARLHEVTTLLKKEEDPKQALEALRERVEACYVESRNDVCYYLRTLGLTQAQAQEAAQEVFLRLYSAMRDGEEIRSPRAWVFRVAHNFGLKVKRRERAVVFEEGTQSANGGDPELQLLQADEDRRMHAALQELSPQQKKVLHLRAEGLRYHEIADALGISASSVNEFLRRAILKLKKVIHG